VLEIGAGTGQDSAYFQEEGFAVVAADLSAVMVEHCRAKGQPTSQRDQAR
jgi:SAM-dependent methyltransferase